MYVSAVDPLSIHYARSCVLSGGAPTPLAHRCSKLHIKIMGDGDRAYMASMGGAFMGKVDGAVIFFGRCLKILVFRGVPFSVLA